MHLIIQSLFLFVFCLASFNAVALDLDVRSNKADTLDFSLLIEHATVELEHDDVDVELNLERIGILSYDVPSSGPHFGLELGYAFSDFSSNDFYQSIAMDGYYIGVAVRVPVIKHGNFSLLCNGRYLYQNISGSEGEQRASLSWNELSANLLVMLSFASPVEIFAGAKISTIDAAYREKGAVNFTDKFDNKNRSGYLAGIEYSVNPLESISFQYQQADIEGVILQFRKLF